ncbi:MAG TPA: GAF domain-containing protein [Melioribacteraceae bacterium]|nr:GAF domain-containing protein [Melioribacteraceae bacterium]
MNVDPKLKKRFYSFMVFPFFLVFTLVTDDMTIRFISIIIIVLCAGIFIFVRDRHIEEEERDVITPIQPENQFIRPTIKRDNETSTDLDETVKIISKLPGATKSEVSEEVKLETAKQTTTIAEEKYFKKPKDLKQKYEKLAISDYPDKLDNDKQFLFVMEIVLEIIKNIYNSNSVIFFWYKQKSSVFSVGRFVSDTPDAIITDKLPKEDDILSKIVTNQEPEIITNIPSRAEKDNLRYYKTPQNIKSFIGVPLFYDKWLAGVLAIDSTDEFAFGIEHVFSLGRFSRLLSMLIWLFNEKSSDTQAEKRLNSLLNVINGNLNFKDESELATLLENSARNLVESDAVTFVYFNPHKKKFITQRVWNNLSLDYIEEGTEIELIDTIVGKVVQTKFPLKVDDVEEKPIKRYCNNEKIGYSGSFMAVPLAFEDEIYGVMCFENAKKKFFTGGDVNILKNTLRFYGFVLFAYSTKAILSDMLTVDPETRILNKIEFFNRVEQQIELVRELKIEGALLLIHIDEFVEEETLFEGNILNRIIKAVVGLIKQDLPVNSIFGRINNRDFGIYLLNTNQNKAFSFAESLRSKIARNPFTILQTQKLVTTSIGVANSDIGKKINDVLKDAELALKKAIEKGGNNTKVA